MFSSAWLDDYLTIVPRGLQDVVMDLLPRQIRENSAGQENVTVQDMQIIGEDPTFDTAHLKELRDRLGKAAAKRERKRRKLDTDSQQIASSNTFKQRTTLHGSIFDTHSNRHVALGYDQKRASEILYSVPGANAGTVWLRFATNATPHSVAACRCIGPLLALVHVYQTPDRSSASMETVLQDLRVTSSSITEWDTALAQWQRHRNISPHGAVKYRCSCVRDDSKKYPYARHELLNHAVEYLRPSGVTDTWKVSLNDFDMEIVWLFRPWSSVIAISLRDPVQVGASSFEKGYALPPDITPPYLQSHGQSNIVRLRPTTAQLLLHMAKLQEGETVVDPCVGIGTIVMECLHLQTPKHLIAMGGDLELKDSFLRSIAVDYETQTRRLLATGTQTAATRHHATLCAWDATTLPLASASVDAIVSDLPFGQTCLSSSQLHQLIPLMLNEFARVLKPSTGRMVLLCGNPDPLLDALQRGNELSENASDDDDDDDNEDDATNRHATLWELPVPTCRPVNIGGHQVWVLRVQRGGSAKAATTSTHHALSKLRNYHAKRDLRRKQQLPQR